MRLETVSALIAQLWSREHTKKQKSKPDFLPSGSERRNTGTWQRLLDCHKGAAEVEPDGLHDCVNIRGPWNKRDVKNKTRKPRRNMLYTFRLENYHKCAILTIDDQNRFNADIRHWFACDCANSGRQLSMKAQLLKTNALATIYDKNLICLLSTGTENRTC